MAADRYRDDAFWRYKAITPAQLLIQDVGLETLIPGSPARLELREVPPSNLRLSPTRTAKERSSFSSPGTNDTIHKLGATRTEQQKLGDLENEYGWMKDLRLPAGQDDRAACRWIHLSSKLPQDLQGVLLGLSDWSVRSKTKLNALRQLDRCIYDHERFSKHGKFFSPFCQSLVPAVGPGEGRPPLLLSIPFLDWTKYPGPTPPLRFNVDPREHKVSSRSSCHPLRSLLQHYYRLENTIDRDRTQVFSRHRPWYGDREIDLKVRQWYGHFPTGLVVDELWMLVIDEKHIVTFSANQTWKARWPPLQLASRISDVSFRRIRDSFFNTDRKPDYTAYTHAISCVHGAVGMVHRGFWIDMPLPCTDRYGGYLSHLQFRLHRSPNTKLVKDLLQIQDELNIVLQITRAQEDVLITLKEFVGNALAFMEEPSDEHHSPETSPARPLTNPFGRGRRQETSSFSSPDEPIRGQYHQGFSPARPITNESTHRHENLGDNSRHDTGYSVPAYTSDHGLGSTVTRDSPDPRYSMSMSHDRLGRFEAPRPPSPTNPRNRRPDQPAAIPRLGYVFRPSNPLDEIVDLLRREHDDLNELRNSSNELATRTVQLVNIRLEDHGRAILVFTLVTIIFLPLSFISSFFGMNLKDIRQTDSDMPLFWTIAICTTLFVLGCSSILAFASGNIKDWGHGRLERWGWRSAAPYG